MEVWDAVDDVVVDVVVVVVVVETQRDRKHWKWIDHFSDCSCSTYTCEIV